MRRGKLALLGLVAAVSAAGLGIATLARSGGEEPDLADLRSGGRLADTLQAGKMRIIARLLPKSFLCYRQAAALEGEGLLDSAILEDCLRQVDEKALYVLVDVSIDGADPTKGVADVEKAYFRDGRTIALTAGGGKPQYPVSVEYVKNFGLSGSDQILLVYPPAESEGQLSLGFGTLFDCAVDKTARFKSAGRYLSSYQALIEKELANLKEKYGVRAT